MKNRRDKQQKTTPPLSSRYGHTTEDSLGLEVIRISQFLLNLVISNKILFKIYLLLFSRMPHLDDIKKIEQPRVKRNNQPRKT